MMEIQEVKCKYCGRIIELSKAVRLISETGKYEYACPACAEKWNIE